MILNVDYLRHYASLITYKKDCIGGVTRSKLLDLEPPEDIADELWVKCIGLDYTTTIDEGTQSSFIPVTKFFGAVRATEEFAFKSLHSELVSLLSQYDDAQAYELLLVVFSDMDVNINEIEVEGGTYYYAYTHTGMTYIPGLENVMQRSGMVNAKTGEDIL